MLWKNSKTYFILSNTKNNNFLLFGTIKFKINNDILTKLLDSNIITFDNFN